MTGVKLSYLSLGEKKLRTVHWRDPLKIRGQNDKDGSLTPLFLAADVMAGSTQPAKNHARIHARYAKEGLASKVMFKGTKIDGISNSSQVWFYNVQGVFQVAFQYHSSEFQKQCLLNLKNLWVETVYNSTLPAQMEIFISGDEQTNNAGIYEPEGIEDYHQIDQSGIPSTSCHDHQQRIVAENTITVGKSINVSLNESDQKRDISILHDCDNRARNNQKSLLDVYDNIIDCMDSSRENLREDEKSKLDKLQTLLQYYKLDILCDEDDNDCFLFDLIKSYIEKIKDCSQTRMDGQHFNLSRKLNIALCLIAENVGKQFFSLQTVISEKVSEFKKQHISSIDSLPPSEEVVNALFPECMINLLLNWMIPKGHRQNIVYDLDKQANKRQRTDADSPQDIYPFVLLILEFANNSLISGVAHVLYTRLLHSS